MKTEQQIAYRHQGGLALVPIFGLLLLIIPLAVIGFHTVQIYMEYFQIREAVSSVKEDVNSYSFSTSRIETLLERRFSLDYLTAIDPKDLKVNKSNGKITIDLIYRDQRNVIGSFAVVGDFNETITIFP
ncbi:MAG: DUF4845 domain-containing protein [Candidatus Competibacterales bacterium]|nr:DUF4845 domain-containing protein [Candidatus Competibacterales bacterium]